MTPTTSSPIPISTSLLGAWVTATDTLFIDGPRKGELLTGKVAAVAFDTVDTGKIILAVVDATGQIWRLDNTQVVILHPLTL